MQYPKIVMSVTELARCGHSATVLKQLARMEGCPCYRASPAPNAKIYFFTDKLDAFIEQNIKSTSAGKRSVLK